MRKIDPIEQEINEIRLRIYEKTKDMTATEFNEYINACAEETAKKYGFKIVATADDK
jgi:hypothetical protein